MRVMLWFSVMKIICDAFCFAMPADWGLQTLRPPQGISHSAQHAAQIPHKRKSLQSVLNLVPVGIKLQPIYKRSESRSG